MAGWKESKGLMVVLLVIIVVAVGYLISRSTGGDEGLPQTYWDEAQGGPVTVTGDVSGLFPPYRHPETGQSTLYKAYICTNHEEPVIFPYKPEFPEGVQPPEPDASSEVIEAYEAQLNPPIPTCPECGETMASEHVEPYFTQEVEEAIEAEGAERRGQ